MKGKEKAPGGAGMGLFETKLSGNVCAFKTWLKSREFVKHFSMLFPCFLDARESAAARIFDMGKFLLGKLLLPFHHSFSFRRGAGYFICPGIGLVPVWAFAFRTVLRLFIPSRSPLMPATEARI